MSSTRDGGNSPVLLVPESILLEAVYQYICMISISGFATLMIVCFPRPAFIYKHGSGSQSTPRTAQSVSIKTIGSFIYSFWSVRPWS